MNSKLLLISSFFVFCNISAVESSATVVPNNDTIMYFVPGTPPRALSAANLELSYESNAVGTHSWEKDITFKLNTLSDMLPPDHDAEANALKESYREHFKIINQDCDRVEGFLKKMKNKSSITPPEQQIFKNYLDTIAKHYEDLSEITFSIGALQDLVFDIDRIEQSTYKVLCLKDFLETEMQNLNLLPDDYDNGLI